MTDSRDSVEPFADLFVIQIAYTKHPGGIETSVQHYDRMLRANGISTLCLYGGPARASLEAEGVDVVDMPPWFANPLHLVFRTGGALRQIVQSRLGPKTTLVAVVHSDRCLPAVQRLFPQAVTIAPCHSDKSDHKARADIIITLNKKQQDLVQTNLKDHRHVLCLGNPYVPVDAQEPWRARPEDDVFRVLFASRFIPTKDPLVLIRAVASLPEDVNCEVLFAGSGVLEEEAKALASSLCVKAVFHGWQDNPWALAAEADCFVLPSHWEGLPFVILEALARGVPVIASDIAGNRRALEDGNYGLLFVKGSDTELANRIREAAADKEGHRAMAEAGKASVFDRFGAQSFGEKFVNAVNSIVEERTNR